MAPENDIQVVSQFVLRARRVAAHSLARSRDSLAELAVLKISGHLTLDGTFTTRHKLPDEEVFESLAARVRPFTLASEPIYFVKLFESLHRLLETSSASTGDEISNRLVKLRAEWTTIDLQGRGQLAFWIQSERRDGSDKSPQVTDIQLAASWMYADLVHSDPKGPKREGLRFTIKERYSAAVNVFSRLALLSLATHDAIMELHEADAIELDPISLETEVVVGQDELVEEGVAYVGPANSPMPSMGAVLSNLAEGWERFTPTVLLRNNSSNRVEVVMTAADGSVVATYDAAVSKRRHFEDNFHWAALIAGVMTAEVAFTVESEAIVESRFIGWVSEATTNQMKMAEAKLQSEISQSETITFFVGKTPLFSLGTPPPDPEEVARLEVLTETLDDLTALEALIQKPLAPLKGTCSVYDRVRLRQARLLLEGNVVPLAPSPMRITSAHGVTPKAVICAAWTFMLGDDTSVPMPAMAVRHPLMQPDQVTEILDSEPSEDVIIMKIPVLEPFVAWVPALVSVKDDEGIRKPTKLGLSHVDEKVLFGDDWDGSISIEHSHS